MYILFSENNQKLWVELTRHAYVLYGLNMTAGMM